MKATEITNKLQEPKRGAWARGVYAYAVELLEQVDRDEEITKDNVKKLLLNGARDWHEYSWGGCSLCYDGDIAARLGNPTELRITRNGERRPNSREEWLDVQARALWQACELIRRTLAYC